ncbi:MAG: NTP transferase domain-containing protein [Thermoplasmatota archaeon]
MGKGRATGKGARFQRLGVVVLAGNKKIKKALRRRRRRGFFLRILNPGLWLATKDELESRLASRINRDDYIVGENKALLYLHPDLISQKNLNFFKRVIYFAGKTGDRVYRKNKKDLLHYLSRDGRMAIDMVVEALMDAEVLDRDRIIIVGPRKQLLRELKGNGIRGISVIEQGASLGDNIILGSKELSKKGYSEEYFLVLGGDVPMISPPSIEDFLRAAEKRGGHPDLFFGMGSRQEMGKFISDHDLDHMGKVGPNRPKKGNFNKFGFPLVDDIGIFGEKNARVNMMIGNMFLYRRSSVDSGFVNRFYSVRKMFANPLTLPYLVFHWARPLYRASKWRLGLSEAEGVFQERTGINMKICEVHPEIALDMDSYTDLRRLSALRFHREGKPHDLELDFKNFVRDKRLERRSKRRKESLSRR